MIEIEVTHCQGIKFFYPIFRLNFFYSLPPGLGVSVGGSAPKWFYIDSLTNFITLSNFVSLQCYT